MKNFKPFLLILAVSISINSSDLLAQKIIGDGNVTKEVRTIAPFDKIQLDGVMSIFLKQDDVESITVESDKNLLPLIEAKVQNNKLIIGTRKDAGIKKSTKMNVYISFKNIDFLEMNGVGNVQSQNQLKLGELRIINSAVGNLNLDLDCDNFTADINSVGSAKFSGKTRNAVIDHNGVGSIKAFDLLVGILRIQSNGVGDSEVNSENEIYIDVNGVGIVSYKGNATVKALNVNGLGKVKKM